MATSKVPYEVAGNSKDRDVHFNHRIFDTLSFNLSGEIEMAKAKAPKADLIVKMAGVETAEALLSDDALLSSMLGDLIEDADESTTTVESSTLEAAVAEVEKASATQALYAEDDTSAEPVAEGDKPTTDIATAEKKAKKAKAPKEPKEPKAPRITSITHKPGDRLVALLGGNKGLLTFLASDDTIAAEKRAEKFIEDMNDRDAIADKVKDKAIMLITWLASGKDTAQLNEVLLRTFKVLFKEGELTSGQKGNLQQDLLSKPYSPGTAASQANQMFMLLPILNVTMREKGRMVLNPDSIIGQAMKIKLGIDA